MQLSRITQRYVFTSVHLFFTPSFSKKKSQTQLPPLPSFSFPLSFLLLSPYPSPSPQLVWIESPTNPTLRIVSVPRLVRIAASHPSHPLVLIDSTFASPYYTNPLSQGVDIVLHSVTKYINGHSDVLMGALIVKKGLDGVFAKLKQLQVSG